MMPPVAVVVVAPLVAVVLALLLLLLPLLLPAPRVPPQRHGLVPAERPQQHVGRARLEQGERARAVDGRVGEDCFVFWFFGLVFFLPRGGDSIRRTGGRGGLRRPRPLARAANAPRRFAATHGERPRETNKKNPPTAGGAPRRACTSLSALRASEAFCFVGASGWLEVGAGEREGAAGVIREGGVALLDLKSPSSSRRRLLGLLGRGSSAPSLTSCTRSTRSPVASAGALTATARASAHESRSVCSTASTPPAPAPPPTTENSIAVVLRALGFGYAFVVIVASGGVMRVCLRVDVEATASNWRERGAAN